MDILPKAHQGERNKQAGNSPSKTKVTLLNDGQSLYVVKPPPGYSHLHVFLGIFIVTLMVVPFACLVQFTVRMGKYEVSAIAFTVYFLFWGAFFYLWMPFFKRFRTYEILHVGPNSYAVWSQFCLRRKDVPMSYGENPGIDRVLGQTQELSLAELVPQKNIHRGFETHTIPAYMYVKEGEKKTIFGVGLDMHELEWILHELNSFISQVTNYEIPAAYGKIV